MNRGSVTAHCHCRECSDCFNEAPIHESGKCSMAGSADGSRPGFNEAPIHESGKLDAHGFEHEVDPLLQ